MSIKPIEARSLEERIRINNWGQTARVAATIAPTTLTEAALTALLVPFVFEGLSILGGPIIAEKTLIDSRAILHDIGTYFEIRTGLEVQDTGMGDVRVKKDRLG